MTTEIHFPNWYLFRINQLDRSRDRGLPRKISLYDDVGGLGSFEDGGGCGGSVVDDGNDLRLRLDFSP